MRKNNEVRIYNKEMVLFYADRLVYPIKIQRGTRDQIIYIYNKEQTKDVFELWKFWVDGNPNYKTKDLDEIEVSYNTREESLEELLNN